MSRHSWERRSRRRWGAAASARAPGARTWRRARCSRQAGSIIAICLCQVVQRRSSPKGTPSGPVAPASLNRRVGFTTTSLYAVSLMRLCDSEGSVSRSKRQPFAQRGPLAAVVHPYHSLFYLGVVWRGITGHPAHRRIELRGASP